MRWTVVIPVKALPAAKSRLLPASTDAAAHRRLVEAIRADTVAAAAAADPVARVLLVTDVEGMDGALVQTRPGLNAALVDAAEHASRRWPTDGVAALVGDLPALQAAELAQVLDRAAEHDRAHVADRAGTGTTLLLAAPGVPLSPAFGPGSAARHGADSIRLDAGPGLRQDVDTVEDLEAAAELGLGDATSAAFADAISAAIAAAPVTRRSTGSGIVVP